MPDIKPIDINNPGSASDVVGKVKAKLGQVPNLFATMAQSPAVLEAYLGFGGALESGSLSAKQREQIALTVAGVNTCDYCASAHSFIATHLGVDQSEVALNLAGRSVDAKTDAILRFAHEVVRERGYLPEKAQSLKELRAAGVSEAEIAEIIAAVALNIFTNYFNHIAGTEIDFPHVHVGAAITAA